MNYLFQRAIVACLPFFVSLAVASHAVAQDSGAAKLKYVEVDKLGNPADVVKIMTEAARPLQSGEVRIKVLATPIHPSDLLQISGNYGVDPALPYTPGSEGVGRVVETSAEVAYLQVGQLVLLAGGGTWREEIVAPASQFIPIADSASIEQEVIEQLAMAVVNPLTAFLMLTTFAELGEDDWIVQSASNSAVGGYVIQLAKQRGVKTVNVVRREGLAEDLLAKGADAVLIDGPDLASEIATATGGAPVSLAIDAVGGSTFARLAASLDYGATLVSYGVLSGQPASFNPAMSIFNDIRIRGFWLAKWFETATMEQRQAAFGQIIPLVGGGSLKADIDSRYSIDEIQQAVSRAAQRGRNGKVLIVPNTQ